MGHAVSVGHATVKGISLSWVDFLPNSVVQMKYFRINHNQNEPFSLFHHGVLI